MKNIEYFVSHNKKIKIRIGFVQYDMEVDGFSASDEIKARFSFENVSFVGYELSTWRGSMDFSFLEEKARKLLFRKKRKTPSRMKCTNGANLGMFSWDGSLRACFLAYNNEQVFGKVQEQNTIDLLLCDERKRFIDNIVNGEHSVNYICKDCLAPYNALDRKVIVESNKKRIETSGNMWFGLKETDAAVLRESAK